MKTFLHVFLILGLLISDENASAKENWVLTENGLADVATAVALYNEQDSLYIESKSKTIFEYLNVCYVEPTQKNVDTAQGKFGFLSKFLWLIPLQKFLTNKILKLLPGTNYTFNDLPHLRKNIIALFRAIHKDVQDGNLKGCQEKLNQTLSKISSERFDYLQSLALKEKVVSLP